jgi:hypothetical protein
MIPTVSLLHHQLLSDRRVPPPRRCIDGPALSVVDQRPDDPAGATRATTEPGMGLPSSSVRPSPRTCNTTSNSPTGPPRYGPTLPRPVLPFTWTTWRWSRDGRRIVVGMIGPIQEGTVRRSDRWNEAKGDEV